MYLNAIYIAIILLLLISLVKYLYQFYANVKRYPPGPIPIPVFGNLSEGLNLYRNRKIINPFLAVHKIGRKYGKLFTLWVGSKPIVVIFDLDVAKSAFNKFEFSGRTNTSLDAIVSDGKMKSLIFMDTGPELNVFRKLSLESMRQILSGNRISALIYEVVNETVGLIKLRENNKKQFSPKTYISNIFLLILAELTFGQKYSFGDEELDFMRHTYELYNKKAAKLMLTDFIPITKYISKTIASNKSEIYKLSELYKSKFKSMKQNYKHGNCDNFCDALITAKLNANLLTERKEYSQFLTDDNLATVLSSLYVAGSDKPIIAFNWILLLISHFPHIQRKLRNEIKDKIGDKVPELPDIKKLAYVNAFICETLRFRNITGIGAPHRTLDDAFIENYLIPKDTMVVLYQYSILNDPKYWSQPEKFSPERFLDESGLFTPDKYAAFIPFGIGKRACVADTMAMDMLVLALVNLLQQTSGHRFVLPNGPQSDDLDYSPEGILFQPKPYEIMLEKN